MRRLCCASLAFAAALLLLSLVFGVDADAAGWLAPVVLAPAPSSGSTGTPGVLIDPHGDQVISWHDIAVDGENCSAGYVSSRVQGGDFVTSQVGCGANVWLSPSGIVYIDGPDDSGGLGEAHAPVGQPLPAAFTHVGSPAAIGTPGDSVTLSGDQLQFDAAGDPTFFYYTKDQSQLPNLWALSAASLNSDGSWTAQQLTQPDSTDSNFVYGVAPDGSALALWPYGGVLDYSRRAAGTPGWSAPAGVGGDPYTSPQLLADPQSRFTMLYQTGSYPNAGISARTMDATGTWGAAQPLTMLPSYSGTAWQLAIDSKGNAAAAIWEVADDVNTDPCYLPDNLNPIACGRLRAFSRAAASTTWVDDGDDLYGPTAYYYNRLTLGFDPQDDGAIELDLRENPAFNTITPFYFSRPAGIATFAATGPPATPPGSNAPALSVDPNGYTVATWVDASGNVVSSVYDAVAPQVDSFNPPADPIAGSPASFGVSGSDLWGPVSYSIDFGDGQTASGRAYTGAAPGPLRAKTNSATVQHTYSQPGTYTAAVTVRDGAANTATSSRSVTVAQGAATPIASIAPPAPIPPVPGLPDPVLGKTANVLPVKPVVLVKAPGAKKFAPLTAPAQIKVGSLIDTRKGRVRITVANGKGGFDTAEFYEGLFKLAQKTTGSKLATMVLSGGSFKGCPRAPRAVLSRKRSASRSVRHLWGSGKGAFRTAGRFSSASIRGTTWKTDDRCNGTLTLVTQGKVAVFDFVKRKTIVVRAHHRYFARPRSTK